MSVSYHFKRITQKINKIGAMCTEKWTSKTPLSTTRPIPCPTAQAIGTTTFSLFLGQVGQEK